MLSQRYAKLYPASRTWSDVFMATRQRSNLSSASIRDVLTHTHPVYGVRRAQTRPFITSPLRQATVCVRNPQTDDQGQRLHIELTPSAIQRLNEIMMKETNPHLALRIQVESGGCHGFQYLMSLITLPPDAGQTHTDSSVVNDDDVIFQYAADETAASDVAVEPGVPKVILDTASLDLLKGSKVDFHRELIGSEFKIKDNPAAKSACGCGTSFDIEL